MDATDVLLLSGEPLSEIYPTPLDHLERRLIGVYRRVMPVDTLLGLQRSREIAGMPFVALRRTPSRCIAFVSSGPLTCW